MKKLIKEILGGFLIAVLFIVITLQLIREGSPEELLVLYLVLQIIAFLFFSIYASVTVALAATFVAIAVLIISVSWFSVFAIITYWGSILLLNCYVKNISDEFGCQKLEIEDKEKSIVRLSNRIRDCTNLLPVLNERVLRYKGISDFSLNLGASFELKKTYSTIIKYLNEIWTDSKISLLSAGDSLHSAKDKYDEWVFENEKSLLVENALSDYRFIKKDKDKIKSLMEYPLLHRRRVEGAIRIENNKYSFNLEDLRLLNVVGRLSSLSIEKAILFIRTKKLAITDFLTKLYTHSYFNERLSEEVARATRYHRKFAVLMLDIDKFKNFNDTYGHPAGDMLLKNISKTLKKTIRNIDIIGRYGGEEFSIILSKINLTGARKIAEKIRKAVANLKLEYCGKSLAVTITIGGSIFPECASAEELIRRADEALYGGKRDGRNQVIFYGDE